MVHIILIYFIYISGCWTIMIRTAPWIHRPIRQSDMGHVVYKFWIYWVDVYTKFTSCYVVIFFFTLYIHTVNWEFTTWHVYTFLFTSYMYLRMQQMFSNSWINKLHYFFVCLFVFFFLGGDTFSFFFLVLLSIFKAMWDFNTTLLHDTRNYIP